MVASNDGRRVFAITTADPYEIVVTDSNGTHTPFATGSGSADRIAVANDGRVFVAAGYSPTSHLDRFGPTGALEATYPLGFGLELFMSAVGNDNCTLYFPYLGGTIRRFNGCTGTLLPDFAHVPEDLLDVEVQPNGELLVAAQHSIFIYSATGVPVRTVAILATYGLGGSGQYPRLVGPNETSFYQASIRNGLLFVAPMTPCVGGWVIRAALDGTEISREHLDVNVGNGLVIGTAATAIPTLRSAVLALLAFALGSAGALALRLRA